MKYRWSAWKVVFSVEFFFIEDLYDKYLESQIAARTERDILTDLHRTFPRQGFFIFIYLIFIYLFKLINLN